MCVWNLSGLVLVLLPLASGCGGDGVDADAGGETVADAERAAATVTGTLTLPAVEPGRPLLVRVVSSLGDPGQAVAEHVGVAGDTTAVDYAIPSVPAGTYFILGFVDVDDSGGIGSTPGDFVGWYGHDGSGEPPADPNAVVPPNGTVRFDFDLVVR